MTDATLDPGAGAPMRAAAVHLHPDGRRAEVAAGDVDRLLDPSGPGDEGWFWLDVVDPTPDHAVALARRFGLDRVTRDDLMERQFPKFEVLDGHRLLVVHALASDASAVRTVEVDVLIGDDWLLTVHAEPVRSIDYLLERVQRSGFAADSPLHLAARLTEFVGERYLPILDELDAQVFDLEDDAVEGQASVLPDIHALRRDVAVLRRVLAPQRRTLELLARQGGLDERARRDLSDAIDHHVQLVDSLDAAHGMVAGLLDTYRGAKDEQMNEVMKVLTVFSAIFLPPTLIAGIYGMNFEQMPELDEPWGYELAWALMVSIVLGLWVYFVRRGFIGGPKLQHLLRPAKAAGRVGRGLASAAVLPIRVAARPVARLPQAVTTRTGNGRGRGTGAGPSDRPPPHDGP